MNSEHDGIDNERRTLLKTIAAGAAVGGVATAGARPVAAQATTLSDYFSNTENASEVTDMTGQSEVTVEVGTDGNGSAFGFGPAVVRVDPGTTVVWEWTGKGGQHNVVADDGSFESEYHSSSGDTFEHAFESAGVTKYYCAPHEMMGMKGAVVVGDAQVSLGGGSGSTAAPGGESGGGNDSGGDGAGGGASVDPDYGDWFANVSNFDGTVDRTGEEEVRIEVGAQGNDGAFAFSPAAVHVDPGATVVWEWTGDGGGHNVYSDDPAFESPTQSEAGATYALEFDGEGVCQYACAPHEAAGMKGAVVVGEPGAAGGGGGIVDIETVLWGLAGTIVAAPFVASQIVANRRRDDEDRPGGRPGNPAD